MHDASLERTNKDLHKEVDKLKLKVTGLEEKVEFLTTENENTNQYSRRNCLRLSGVKETESTDKILMDVISALGLDLTLEQVDRTHRLGPHRKPEAAENSRAKHPRDIILKFVSYRPRQKCTDSVRS